MIWNWRKMAITRKSVVVVIPTYNEKGNVGRSIQVLEEEVFPKVSPDWEMNLLIVDDSSPDGTSDEIRALQKIYPNLNLLENPRKGGLGNAYIKGFYYAMTKLKAQVLCEFDADLQHDPAILPFMLNKISEGYDLVLGSRYIKGGGIPEKWGLIRKFYSIFGNLFIRVVLTKFSIHDWTGGYRAIKRQVVEEILPALDQERFMGYTFQIGFLHKAVRAGYKVAEVPFHFRDRTLGKSKLGAEYIKNTLLYILKVRFREITNARVFKFAVVGLVGAIIQLSTLEFGRQLFPYQLAYFISLELAVLSNFILSNRWTFADRKLVPHEIPGKFIQFNLASLGSIIIQQVLAFLGESFIGLKNLFVIPAVSFQVDTGIIFAVVGILLGMVWNFFAYSRFVWKKNQPVAIKL
jgi:dolichol-phosphate mannosyltransferase